MAKISFWRYAALSSKFTRRSACTMRFSSVSTRGLIWWAHPQDRHTRGHYGLGLGLHAECS